MPDHPDDAPKRRQRGVLPPFFAPRPRSDRGEAPPVPPSGSWRRISRLFTPPDVARQGGAIAGPQTSSTPPSTPRTEPAETPEATLPPAAAAPIYSATPVPTPVVTPVGAPFATNFPFDSVETAGERALDDISWPTPDLPATAGGDRSPGADPFAIEGMRDDELVFESLEPVPVSLAMPDPATAHGDAGIEQLEVDALHEARAAEEGRADVDHAAAGEVWTVDRSALDDIDERNDSASGASGHAVDPSDETYWAAYEAPASGPVDTPRTTAGSALASEAESWGAAEVAPSDDSWEGTDVLSAHEDESPDVPPAHSTYENPARDLLDAASDEVRDAAPDAVPGRDAFEPSVVWHSYERESPAPKAATPAERRAGEYGAPTSDGALAESESPTELASSAGELASRGAAEDTTRDADRDAHTAEGEVAKVAESEISLTHEVTNVAPPVSDVWTEVDLPEPAFGTTGWPAADEMSAALAWNDGDVVRDRAAALGDTGADVPGSDDTFSTVAHELRDTSSTWGSVDSVSAEVAHDSHERAGEGDIGTESGSSSESTPQSGAGAAIADALARVAERIRAGEVALSPEAAGTSDESALAAALAALLRGPRRD